MTTQQLRCAVLWLVWTAMVAAVPAASGQTPDPGRQPAPGVNRSQAGSQSKRQPSSLSDKKFVRWAIETDNAEIGAAQTALQATESNDVREFAQLMIHDHTMLNDQLKPLAQKLDVAVAPGELTAKQQALADQLKPLRGTAFDQQYIAAMVKGHRLAVKRIGREIRMGQIPEVKQAARKAEPTIARHLQLAQNLAHNHHVKIGKP